MRPTPRLVCGEGGRPAVRQPCHDQPLRHGVRGFAQPRLQALLQHLAGLQVDIFCPLSFLCRDAFANRFAYHNVVVVRWHAPVIGGARLCECRSDLGERAALLQLFDKYAAPAIGFALGEGDPAQARAPLKQALPSTALNMVQQLCELLSLLLRSSGRVQDLQARLGFIFWRWLSICA